MESAGVLSAASLKGESANNGPISNIIYNLSALGSVFVQAKAPRWKRMSKFALAVSVNLFCVSMFTREKGKD